MSPRKRRSLALPFLVTVATACTVKPGAADDSTANSQPAQGQTRANPPPPSSQAGGAVIDPNKMAGESPSEAEQPQQKPPTLVVNPPPPTTLPAAPTEGGRLETRADQTCWWYQAADCPKDKNISCNPPPPRQVSCPTK